MLIRITFLIFLATNGFAQSDTVFIISNKNESSVDIDYLCDTLLFDSPQSRILLYNTMVLPNTSNQQEAKNYGLTLDSIGFESCKSREIMKYSRDEISLVEETDDNLSITIMIVGNCCHNFLCDIEIRDESILNLIYLGYGSMYCSCSCNFQLTYYFSKWKFMALEYDRIKKIMINGNLKTLKNRP